MDKIEIFKKELAMLLKKHNAELYVEERGGSLELSFDLRAGNTYGYVATGGELGRSSGGI